MCNRAYMHQLGLGGEGPNYPAAIMLYDRSIELNHLVAMCNRAAMYRCGQGEINRQPNCPAAVDLYKRAIALGSPLAIHSLAEMYRWGEGGPCDYSAAIELYEKAIESGDAHAMCQRAMMYELGLGTVADDLAAAQLYKQAIGLGDRSAGLRRERMEDNFLLRKIPTPDLEEVREFLIKPIRHGFKQLVNQCLKDNRKARNTLHKLITKDMLPGLSEEELAYLRTQLSLLAMENHAPALVLKGLMHHLGRGYPLSYLDAIVLYERAIVLNDAFAMCNRGYMYLNGQGEIDEKSNESAAIELYQRAITLGNPYAMCMLATYYSSTDSDYHLTIPLYDEAVALGDVWAMRTRAEMYRQGVGEVHNKPDYLSAMILYEKASALRDVEAMYDWGEMCQYELKNIPAAMALYARASALGHSPAHIKLQDLTFDVRARTQDKFDNRHAEKTHAGAVYSFFTSIETELTADVDDSESDIGADLTDTPRAFV